MLSTKEFQILHSLPRPTKSLHFILRKEIRNLPLKQITLSNSKYDFPIKYSLTNPGQLLTFTPPPNTHLSPYPPTLSPGEEKRKQEEIQIEERAAEFWQKESQQNAYAEEEWKNRSMQTTAPLDWRKEKKWGRKKNNQALTQSNHTSKYLQPDKPGAPDSSFTTAFHTWFCFQSV